MNAIKYYSLCLILSLSCFMLQAQNDTNSCHCAGMAKQGKGTFYITAGYQLDWFTNSTIHLNSHGSGDYNFTLYNVKAVDRPGFENLFNQNITIPQYSFRIGYWFNNKKDIGVELNYDHVKYVVVQYQKVHMKGSINGIYYDKDTILVPTLIEYEHTNGANYAMIDIVKRHNFYHSKNELHWVSFIGKAGLGIVIPRSDTRIIGLHRNDTYHVAGIVTGVEAGLRYDFLRYFFLETTLKPCYANYFNVFLYGDGIAKQHWFSLEYVFTLGIQFPAKLF